MFLFLGCPRRLCLHPGLGFAMLFELLQMLLFKQSFLGRLGLFDQFALLVSGLEQIRPGELLSGSTLTFLILGDLVHLGVGSFGLAFLEQGLEQAFATASLLVLFIILIFLLILFSLFGIVFLELFDAFSPHFSGELFPGKIQRSFSLFISPSNLFLLMPSLKIWKQKKSVKMLKNYINFLPCSSSPLPSSVGSFFGFLV